MARLVTAASMMTAIALLAGCARSTAPTSAPSPEKPAAGGPVAPAAEVWHSLTFDTKDRTCLRPRGHLQVLFAIECLDLDLGTKSGLGKGDGNRRIKVGPLTFELLMFADMNDDEQVSRRPAVDSSFALTGLQARSGGGANYFFIARGAGTPARTFRFLNADGTTAASFTGANWVLLRTR